MNRQHQQILGGRLEGKIALITGANSGIGLASARRFVKEGAYVYITARRQEQLDEVVAAIGKNVTAVHGDIANLADLDHIYSVIKSAHNHLDIIFANAGSGTFEALGHITEEGFDLAFTVCTLINFPVPGKSRNKLRTHIKD